MTLNEPSQKKRMKSQDWRINSTNIRNNKTKILAYSFGGIVLLIVAILIFIESYNKFFTNNFMYLLVNQCSNF